MRKKLLSLLAGSLLLFNSITASAADNPLLNAGNNYAYNKVGGTSTYTVPYTGNYEITLSGTQGSAYSDNSGGAGYTLTKSVRLKYEDVIKVELPERPVYETHGDTINVVRGNSAKLYINDEKIWEADGGTGLVNNQIAPDDINWVQTPTYKYSVHWHSGNGLSGPKHSNQFPTVYKESAPDGCYRWAGHKHDATRACPSHTCTSNYSTYSYRLSLEGCPYCGSTNTETWYVDEWYHPECGRYDMEKWAFCNVCKHTVTRSQSNGVTCPERIWDCGYYNNTWSLGCNKQQGQIEGINNAAETPGTCYYNTSAQYSAEFKTTSNFTPDTAVLNNNAVGKFSIKLLEQDSLYNAGVSYRDDKGNTHRVTDAVRVWHYDDGKGAKGRCNLVLVDNVVTYFKRR